MSSTFSQGIMGSDEMFNPPPPSQGWSLDTLVIVVFNHCNLFIYYIGKI